MAAPIPPTNHDGADGEDAELSAIPKSAEDRKAAAALSAVSARDDDTAKPLKEADQEALGKAIQALDINGSGTPKGEEQKEIKKKVVKVDPEAVALLVEELDLSKSKATELLKLHNGIAVDAMRAFVTAEA